MKIADKDQARILNHQFSRVFQLMIRKQLKSNLCVQETSNEITEAMTLLIKTSLTQSDIPDPWRLVLISLLFKGGKKDRNKAENYRPVSLMSISCKLLEHILLHSNIMKHLENNNILRDLQHGFRKHQSCETKLIKTVNNLAKSINHGEQINNMLLDFSKVYAIINCC